MLAVMVEFLMVCGVLKNCSLYQALEDKVLKIPRETHYIPGTDQCFPHVIVADDAFPLKEYTMKPYSQNTLTCEKNIQLSFKSRTKSCRECFWQSFSYFYDTNGPST